MERIIIPIQFFDALKKQPPLYRLLWFEWLSQGEKVLDPSFSENLRYDNVSKEKIKECYAIGIELLQEGIILENKKIDKGKEIKSDIASTIKEIIEYLNGKAGTSYKYKSATTIQLITGRMGEGFTKNDFIKVIDNKVEQWKGTEQEQYLRPITLFSKSKFESYLNKPKNGAKKPTSTVEQVRNAINEAKSKLFD
jgi:uncharacterized phage protein (TIGR02220 family)